MDEPFSGLDNRLRDGILSLAQTHDEAVLLQGFPACYTLLFTDRTRLDNHAATGH